MFRNDTNIDWDLISDAIKLYKIFGYEYIEVPWMVSKEAMETTFKGEVLRSSYGCAVGSAEQSFIQMMMDGDLKPDGKYVAASPCFRQEKVFDDIHFPYFFKIELICFTEDDARQCIEDAFTFFSCGVLQEESLEIVETPEGHDINLNDIEIGSYGWREAKGFKWFYGTGLAEPRYSIARKK